MVNPQVLRKELATALNTHITLLRDIELIEVEHMDAFTFMIRSFSFILAHGPSVLLEDDDEALNYMMFQYYSLLNELKYNLILNFPYARLHGKSLVDSIAIFPTTYEKELKLWWEKNTGLLVEETKQTIAINSLEY